jgi:S1-C subfamily serine protease
MAGIIDGDVIVTIDNVTVRTVADIAVYMERNTTPDDSVELEIIRDGIPLTITVPLGERPPQ